MRVVGIDPSSSCCGLALVEDDHLVCTDAWVRPKLGSAPTRLVYYTDWLTGWLLLHEPDIAVIEFLSVERNAQSTRVVAFYQALSAMVCKRQGLVVIEARVSSARKITLGNGGLSKRAAFDLIVARFSDHDFGRWKKDTGGPAADKTDATVLALAHAGLVERS